MSRPLRGVVGVALAVSAGLGLFGSAAAAPQARAVFGCGGAAPQAGTGERGSRFLLQVGTATSSFAQMEVVSASGRVIRRIAKVDVGGVHAAVSPNGKLVAWEGAYGVFVKRVDGSARRLVMGAGIDAGTYGWSSFTWSPDSKAILVTAPTGVLDIFSVATRAKRAIVKPQGQETLEALAWPRLKRIVFLRTGPARVRVVLADRRGSSRRTILQGSIDYTYNVSAAVAVSPSRECINVTTFFDTPGDPPSSQFRSANVVTREETRVRSFDNYDGAPIWSPDSSRLLTYVAGGPLTIMSPTGKVLETFRLRQEWAGPVAWTQSAIYLLFSQEKIANKLFEIPAGHTTADVVFTLPKGQEIYSAQPF